MKVLEKQRFKVYNITNCNYGKLNMGEQLDMFTTPPKTTVVNIKKSGYDVYIGRGSIWGNPYSHLDESQAKIQVKTRKEAIEKYRMYIVGNKELMAKLPELRGRILGCFCVPKSCHGHILAELADKL